MIISYLKKYIILLLNKMIIPIRCFTCGKLVGNLWELYRNMLQEELNKFNNSEGVSSDTVRSIESQILDKLEIKRYCCRRMLLSHVDLCEKI